MYALMGEWGDHWKAGKNAQGRGDVEYTQTSIHSEKNI